MNIFSRNAVYAAASMVLGSVVSIGIAPKGLTANGGVSYYGNYNSTLFTYSLGLLLAGWFTFRIAQTLPKIPSLLPIKILFGSMGPVILAAIIVPYATNIGWLHRDLSIGLFAIESLIAIWMVFAILWDSINVMLLLLLCLDIIFAIVYLTAQNGYLLHAEILFEIIFATLVVRSFQRLPAE